jgi:hypothetical protein
MKRRNPASRHRVAKGMTYGLKQNTNEVGEPAKRLMRMSKPCQHPFLNLNENQLQKPERNHTKNGCESRSYQGINIQGNVRHLSPK